MKVMTEDLRLKAIQAVKIENRLISEVASEYGVSKRKLYSWLNNEPNDTKPFSEWSGTVKLKSQIHLLQTEVKQLKRQLNQYKISERLEDGKIVLDFTRRNNHIEELQKTG